MSAEDAAMSRPDEIAALRSGESLPAERVIQLRSAGMAAVRTELIRRMLRGSAADETLFVYWEHGHQAAFTGQAEAVVRKLICGHRNRVTGEFQDLWLLCYPDDGDIKQSVEREIDRMVEAAKALAAADKSEG